MFEKSSGPSAGIVAFEATGTVIASDVENALSGLSGARGALITIGNGFDGYLAELVRGARAVAEGNSGLRIAIALDQSLFEEANNNLIQPTTPNLRLFLGSQQQQAIDWLAGKTK